MFDSSKRGGKREGEKILSFLDVGGKGRREKEGGINKRGRRIFS